MIQQHKYLTLDAIRGVAAIFVITRHAGDLLGGWQFLHSYLAVDLFFVMSGLVISIAYDNSLLSNKLSSIEFMKIRFVRLYPLYFLALMMSSILALNHAAHATHAVNWVELLLNIALGIFLIPSIFLGDKLFPLNGPSWTIFFEIMANYLYAKFRIYLTTKVLCGVLAVSAVSLLFLVNMNHSMDFGFNRNNAIGGLARVLYSFGAGLLISRIRKTHKFEKLSNNWMSLIILLLVIVLLGLPIEKYFEIYELTVVLIIFPILVLFATYIEPRNVKIAAIYSTLGLTSYAVYILQVPFLYAYSAVFIHHLHSSMFLGFIAILLLFFFAYIADKFYDKPVRFWMRSFIGAKRNEKIKI